MPDLDDPQALVATDRGRLMAIARAGAVVRQVARAEWLVEAALRGEEVGAAAVIVADTIAPAYGDAFAELSMRLGAPIAAALRGLAPRGEFPRAADALLIVSDTGLERSLLDDVHLAASRGASVHVVAPTGSPIAQAARERRVALAEFEPTDEPLTAWWAAVGTLVAAWRGPGELEPLADLLDDTAAQLGPVVPMYDNPAKQIATLDGPLLVVALDDDAALAAPILAHELGAYRDSAAEYLDVRRGFAPLVRYAERAPQADDDLFYDPQIDGPTPAAATRQLVLLSGVTDRGHMHDLVPTAERIGSVRVVEFGSQERHNALALVALAQLSGTFYSLAND